MLLAADSTAVSRPPVTTAPVHTFEMHANLDDPNSGSGGLVKVRIADPRNAGTPGAPALSSHVTFQLSWGADLIDVDRDVADTPRIRSAATAVFDALAGSQLLKRTVPAAETDVEPGVARITLSHADGNQTMLEQPVDSDPLPGDPKLGAALKAWMTLALPEAAQFQG